MQRQFWYSLNNLVRHITSCNLRSHTFCYYYLSVNFLYFKKRKESEVRHSSIIKLLIGSANLQFQQKIIQQREWKMAQKNCKPLARDGIEKEPDSREWQWEIWGGISWRAKQRGLPWLPHAFPSFFFYLSIFEQSHSQSREISLFISSQNTTFLNFNT